MCILLTRQLSLVPPLSSQAHPSLTFHSPRPHPPPVSSSPTVARSPTVFPRPLFIRRRVQRRPPHSRRLVSCIRQLESQIGDHPTWWPGRRCLIYDRGWPSSISFSLCHLLRKRLVLGRLVPAIEPSIGHLKLLLINFTSPGSYSSWAVDRSARPTCKLGPKQMVTEGQPTRHKIDSKTVESTMTRPRRIMKARWTATCFGA